MLLMSYLRTYCQIQGHEELSLCSPKTFMVLGTQVLEPFLVNFCIWCDLWVQLHSYAKTQLFYIFIEPANFSKQVLHFTLLPGKSSNSLTHQH